MTFMNGFVEREMESMQTFIQHISVSELGIDRW